MSKAAMATATKERPILFSGEMVKAILEGRKTQTRRLVSPQFTQLWGSGCPNQGTFHLMNKQKWQDAFAANVDIETATGHWLWVFCPKGKAGDRLWVRETWADVNTESGPGIAFRSDNSIRFCADDAFPVEYERYPGMKFSMWAGDLFRGEDGHSWRPSMFMPRWASRISLEVVSVRIERLQAITEDDAKAEGVPVGQRGTIPGVNQKSASCVNCGQHYNQHLGMARVCYGGMGDTFSTLTYKGGFAFLWDQINGKKAPWEGNPWVWVIKFKRVDSTA